MITLDVAVYCQNCPDFDPRVTYMYSDGRVCQTSITCANAERCNQIALHLAHTPEVHNMRSINQNAK